MPSYLNVEKFVNHRSRFDHLVSSYGENGVVASLVMDEEPGKGTSRVRIFFEDVDSVIALITEAQALLGDLTERGKTPVAGTEQEVPW